MGTRRSLYSVTAILLAVQCSLACAGPKPQNPSLKTGTVNLNQYWRLTFEQDYIADDQGGDICFTVELVWIHKEEQERGFNFEHIQAGVVFFV